MASVLEFQIYTVGSFAVMLPEQVLSEGMTQEKKKNNSPVVNTWSFSI